MEYARRGPKRICRHMIRPSALSAMDILYSKTCVDKAIALYHIDVHMIAQGYHIIDGPKIIIVHDQHMS